MGEEPPQEYKSQNSKIALEEPEKSVGSFFVGKFLKIEVVSDIKKCEKLWLEFSPMKTLFDTWEFRYAFYLAYKYKPYFLVVRKNGENLACLPLWYEDNNFYDKNLKRFTWFGSDWQEENKFFAKSTDLIPVLLSLAPAPLYLNAISKDEVEKLKGKIEFKEDEPKYVLNLKGFKNHEDYLMTLKKNTRRNLRKDRNRILKQKPEIVIDNFSDLEILIKLAKKRFGEKGESVDWDDARRVETFKNVIKFSGKSYKVRMIKVKVGGKEAGVDLICIFNKTYFAVKCGYNISEFSGIGNFFNLYEIDDAIKLGLEKIDFLQNNYQWKNKYFPPVPLYQYQK
jgi:CelD/BcsL family acetyltransferase involved in cellulose biosynthesis